MGSKSAVNNEPVAVAAKAIETFDCLMASKKKIQCAAMINPTPIV